MRAGLGIDLGGTNLRAALIAPDGQIIASTRQPLAGREPEAVVVQARRLVEHSLEKEHQVVARQAPICIGVAGQVHPQSGDIVVAPNLGWRDVPFATLLSDGFDRPVRLLNDLSAIALGEARVGAGRGADDLVCIFVGTGVGMGALLRGRLVEGSTGMAAELGHVKVESPTSGQPCGCGGRGCLEAYTSGAHLAERLVAKIAAGTPSRLMDEVHGDLTALHAGNIEAAAADGDPAAVALWEEIALLLARAVGMVVPLFDPEVLVLGGGVLDRAATLRRWTHERLPRFISPAYAEHLRIVDSELGDDAGVIGAGIAAMTLTSDG